jgi:hypothetical protein
MAPGERSGAAVRLLAEHVAEPFSLEEGILVRVLAMRLGPEDHLVSFALHHLAVDGRSAGLVLGQIADAYRDGGQAPEPGTPLSALDVYAWQAARMADGSHAPHTETWRRVMGETAGEPDLSYDRPRLARVSLMPAQASVRFPASCADAVRALSADLGVTPFMTVLAAFAVLLSGGQPAVRIGTTVSMRGRPELAEVVGLLSTTAALGIPVDERGGFAEAARRVRDLLLDAHTAADQPFAVAAEAVAREQGIDQADLARVLVIADEPPPCPDGWRDPGPLPGVARPVVTTYDLVVSVRMEDSAVDCEVVYRGELFNAETIDTFMNRLGELIGEVAEDPGAPLTVVKARLTSRTDR